MAKKNKVHRKLAKWHRSIGMLSAIFVVLLATTGLLLNHANHLALEKTFVGSHWLVSLYDLPSPSIRSFKADRYWISESEGRLYRNDLNIGRCRGQLIGFDQQELYEVLVCSEEILLLTHDFELIEKIGESHGLPLPIQRFDSCGVNFCFTARGNAFEIDMETVVWQALDALQTPELKFPEFEELPIELAMIIRKDVLSQRITWEKLILDIHAGRFMGSMGILIMDLIALAFLLLSASGIYMWFTKNRGRFSR